MKKAVLVFIVLLCAICARASEPASAELRSHNPGRYAWVFKESVALGVPEKELAALVDECRDKGFSSDEVRRLIGLVARAKLAGLPHGDLLLKLKEGLAKGASPALIDSAMADKAMTLKLAKNVVDTLTVQGFVADDLELAVKMVADAIEAGLSQQQVMNLIRSGQPTPRGVPDPGRLFHDFSDE